MDYNQSHFNGSVCVVGTKLLHGIYFRGESICHSHFMRGNIAKSLFRSLFLYFEIVGTVQKADLI